MAKRRAETDDVAAPASVMIELPVGHPAEDGYEAKMSGGGAVKLKAPARLHVNAHLGKRAAVALLRVRNGLRQQGARMEDGKPVWSSIEALRYILETIDKAAG